MQDPAISRNTVSFGLSLAICAVLNALLVIAKEKSTGVQAWMQKMTGHHWITHVVIVLAVFIALGLVFGQANRRGETKISADLLAKIVVAGVVVGVLIIGGFYLFGD